MVRVSVFLCFRELRLEHGRANPGTLVVAKANPARYDEVKRYTVADSAVWAHPAFAGRTIVVKDVNTLTVWGF